MGRYAVWSAVWCDRAFKCGSGGWKRLGENASGLSTWEVRTKGFKANRDSIRNVRQDWYTGGFCLKQTRTEKECLLSK